MCIRDRNKGTIDEKFAIFAKGAGEENILIMLMIFVLAGAFSTVAKAMGGVDATVNLGIYLVPARFITAGVFIISAFLGVATGTSKMCIRDRDDVQVLMATGSRDYEKITEALAKENILYEGQKNIHLYPYLDHMELALAAADLYIGRAGATTLAELTVRGLDVYKRQFGNRGKPGGRKTPAPKADHPGQSGAGGAYAGDRGRRR